MSPIPSNATEDRALAAVLPPSAAAEPLLPTVSIVEQAMAQARRSLALALCGTALIVVGLLADRWWVSSAHEAAADHHGRAQRVAGAIRLADERLTSAAQMAVSTGERRWIDEYDARLPELQAALEEGKAFAPAAIVGRFDQQTRAAAEELASLRESAFEAVTVGAVDSARAIFDSERYRHNTRLLTAATAEFTEAAVQAAQEELQIVTRRAVAAGTVVLVGTLLLGALLWLRLTDRLRRSREFLLEAEDRMQRLASSDLLTGLFNRAALHDAMAAAMARADRDGRGLAVLMIDLDRFKPINDRFGHMIGDRVLKVVAQRLKLCLRGGELQARYGGDEFVVVIHDARDPVNTRKVAQRIMRALSEPMTIDQLTLSIGASVGIARYPDDARSADDLLRKADSALYRAKVGNRGEACFYESSLDEQVAERSVLEQAIRDGIVRGEFVPFYQPIVDLAGRSVQSLELLARWKHPTRGMLAPAHFITLAENAGLIGPLLMSVLRQACADLAQFPAHWRLSVNVAPQQILDPTLVPQLLAVLRENGIPPQRLDVELTETALVSDTARAREVMQALKDAGITVTLDDFGTGYSSLAYLAEMTFDRIKIDRSFVSTLHDRSGSTKIVDAVIQLSHSLGVQAVAEGVETEQDVEMLLNLGCDLAQGYLFGRPLPAEQLTQATGPVAA